MYRTKKFGLVSCREENQILAELERDVEHKNEITDDNRLDNLEWCTQTYNNNYGNRIAKQAKALVNGKRAKPVGQYTLDGKLIKIWPSTRECERNGFKHSGVGACCLGKWPTYKGYKWKYIK